MLAGWMLIGLAVALAVVSLRNDVARGWYVASRLDEGFVGELPPATVIVPVKGEDEGLRENLASLAALDYPDYELLVVARAAGDIPDGVVPETARVVIAGDGEEGTGEKIHNLVAGVREARPGSRVFAFADSDGRVRPGWLRALAAGLAEGGAGAATGYRWHAPEPPEFWSMLRSAWNGVIAGGFGSGDQSFAWGGAMAIRRDVFERARVAEFWRGSVSDDYALSAAVRAAGLRIVFAPGAFVASTDHTTARKLLGWIRRQMLITRVYRPKLWAVGAVAHVLYCSAQVAAVVMAVSGNWTALGGLAAIWGLGAWKGANRTAAARRMLPALGAWFRRHGWVYPVLDPLSTWLWMYGFAASAIGNSIEWRGNRYRLSRKL